MTALAREDVILGTGRYLGVVEPGSPQWLSRMTASKIAAVLGLSPYESRFSLWHRMAGLAAPEPDNDLTRRGHYLEPAIRAWFSDQHPDWQVTTTGTWAHVDRDWQAASPDGLVTGGTDPAAVLECKTATNDWEWGEPGSDEIPVYYRAQVLWQLDTLGLTTAHVAVLTTFMDFREYVVTYDPDEAAFLRAQAAAFLASLPDGDSPARPDIDGHAQTYLVLRQLPDGVDETPAQLSPDVAARYRAAQAAAKAADLEKRAAASAVLDAMGNARRAECDGVHIATRAVKPDGTTHSLKPARGLTSREEAHA